MLEPLMLRCAYCQPTQMILYAGGSCFCFLRRCPSEFRDAYQLGHCLHDLGLRLLLVEVKHGTLF